MNVSNLADGNTVLPNVSRIVVVGAKGILLEKHFTLDTCTMSIQDDGRTIKLFIKE